MKTKQPQRPPTAAEIDALAGKYEFLQQQLEEANDAVTPVHDALVRLTKRYGNAHAEKSQLLAGNEYEVVVSKRTSTKIEMHALSQVREALKAAGKAHLFRFLFDHEDKYSVAATATETLGKPVMPKKAITLFHQAVKITPKADALDVRQKKEK